MSAIVKALDTLPRYASLLRSQYWAADQLGAYTERQLDRTLKAAAKIPFYKTHFGGPPRLQDFARLPILERTDIAALNASVRSMYPPGRQFLWGASSGSTAIEAEFLFDRTRVRGRYAARMRYLRAHGWNPMRRTMFHQVVHPEDSDWVRHRFLPGFMGVSNDLAAQVERVIEFDPLYLYTYPSNIEGMLQVLEETNRKLRSLRRIFTIAETVDEALRERTRRILGVEIADNYGATEGFIAWQCPQGSYHINAEHVFVELVDEEGRQVPPGDMGRVIITTLENFLMPLVRYDLTDYAIAAEGTCRCGRTLPLLSRVVGRKRSLFRHADGRLYFPYVLVDSLRLAQGIKIQQYQLIQMAPEAFRVRYLADREIDSVSQAAIRAEFETILGTPATVVFERVPEFARTKSGKFLRALSEVDGMPAAVISTSAG
jgi:phenylacetate-CoA ligase